jgi:hypothetical protein
VRGLIPSARSVRLDRTPRWLALPALLLLILSVTAGCAGDPFVGAWQVPGSRFGSDGGIVIAEKNGGCQTSFVSRAGGTWLTPGWIPLSRHGDELRADLKVTNPSPLPPGAWHIVIDYLPASGHLRLRQTPGPGPVDFERAS